MDTVSYGQRRGSIFRTKETESSEGSSRNSEQKAVAAFILSRLSKFKKSTLLWDVADDRQIFHANLNYMRVYTGLGLLKDGRAELLQFC